MEGLVYIYMYNGMPFEVWGGGPVAYSSPCSSINIIFYSLTVSFVTGNLSELAAWEMPPEFGRDVCEVILTPVSLTETYCIVCL